MSLFVAKCRFEDNVRPVSMMVLLILNQLKTIVAYYIGIFSLWYSLNKTDARTASPAIHHAVHKTRLA
jgi:hypothetical protein